MKLDDQTPIFVGFKLDGQLRRQLDAVSGADRRGVGNEVDPVDVEQVAIVGQEVGHRRIRQQPAHRCANFVDTDGDGVCDNCSGTGTPAQDGTGQQMRRGGRR